jgi:hypothetical protein
MPACKKGAQSEFNRKIYKIYKFLTHSSKLRSRLVQQDKNMHLVQDAYGGNCNNVRRYKETMKRLFALFVLILFALAACGSAGSSTSSSTGGATATTTANCLATASGTIQQVSNGSLLLTNLQGKNVQVTLTSATLYTRQSALTSSELKTGAAVSLVVALNPDNTYTALTVVCAVLSHGREASQAAPSYAVVRACSPEDPERLAPLGHPAASAAGA